MSENLAESKSVRPLRVFQLIKGFGLGGAERLLSEGYAVADKTSFTYGYGYFLAHKSALANDLRKMGAEVKLFRARTPVGMLAQIPRLASFLRTWEADVVHCHLPLAATAGRLAAAIAGVPVVYTAHNHYERFHFLSRHADLLTWRLQRRVLTVSEEVAASVRRHAHTLRPVEVVPNGVAVERFAHTQSVRLETRHNLGISSDAAVVGTVAVFRPQKRLHLWLQAARRILDQAPATRFILVGDGLLAEDVQEWAQELRLNEVLVLPGLQESVAPFLAAMDVYMMSSSHEGMPVALLEAMASELPVVSTTVGGVPEVMGESGTGFLVPSHPDEQAICSSLAEHVVRLLKDEKTRTRFGRGARQRIAEHFSMKQMTRRLEEIYREVAEEGRTHA